MKNLLLFAVLASVPPQVDQAEILRHGDMVQKIDGDWQDDRTAAAVEALGPPASDAHKWFISVITQQGCASCQRLKDDWNRGDTTLTALANPLDRPASWAHLNFYDAADASQAWRWEGLHIQAYPTILVQPPRTGQYGDPGTVVHQVSGYAGDPQAVTTGIVDSIKAYVATLQPSVYEGSYHADDFGLNPPWNPPPKNDPTTPSMTPLQNLNLPFQLVPPQKVTTPTDSGLPWYVTYLALPLLGAAALYGLNYVRAQRLQQGKPQVLTDEQLAAVKAMVEQMTKKP